MRLAGLEEAAAEVADAVEPAGGVALRLGPDHGYFFLDFALPLPLAALAPFDFAPFASAAHSSA